MHVKIIIWTLMIFLMGSCQIGAGLNDSKSQKPKGKRSSRRFKLRKNKGASRRVVYPKLAYYYTHLASNRGTHCATTNNKILHCWGKANFRLPVGEAIITKIALNTKQAAIAYGRSYGVVSFEEKKWKEGKALGNIVAVQNGFCGRIFHEQRDKLFCSHNDQINTAQQYMGTEKYLWINNSGRISRIGGGDYRGNSVLELQSYEGIIASNGSKYKVYWDVEKKSIEELTAANYVAFNKIVRVYKESKKLFFEKDGEVSSISSYPLKRGAVVTKEQFAINETSLCYLAESGRIFCWELDALEGSPAEITLPEE